MVRPVDRGGWAVTRATPLNLIVALGLGTLGACQLVVDTELSEVRCTEEGFVGEPTCPPGNRCEAGRCVRCEESGCGVSGEGGAAGGEGRTASGGGEPGAGAPSTNGGAGGDPGAVPLLPAVSYRFDETEDDWIEDEGWGAPVALSEGKEGTFWLDDGGVWSDSGAYFVSSSPLTKVASACSATNAVTIEALVASTGVGGSIVSLSSVDGLRLELRDWRVTPNDHTELSLFVDGALASTSNDTLQLNGVKHVVVSRWSDGHVMMFRDGRFVAEDELKGEIEWESDLELRIAEGWEGCVYALSIYCRSMESDEVAERASAVASFLTTGMGNCVRSPLW